MEPLCFQMVKSSWESSDCVNILDKINFCDESLQEWGKEIMENFNSRIKERKLELKRLRSRRDADALEKYREEKKKLFMILEQKEVYWRQRSKQLWLKSGDRNTKYFHTTASARRRMNQILKLRDKEDKWVKWEDGLADLITEYYDELFKSSQMGGQVVVDCIEPKVNEDQNREMLCPIEEDEVKMAQFQMNPDKSPGTDGMTPAFYQKHWSIVSKDVVNSVREFFQQGMITPRLNGTNIVLIPKKKNLSIVGDLRPISLCNVLMRIIKKSYGKSA